MLPWVEMISTIRFDLEEGPVLDFSFPQSNFNENFVKKLAYPAFPDSYTLLSEDQMFYVFSIQQQNVDFGQHVYSRESLQGQNGSGELGDSGQEGDEDEAELTAEMIEAVQKQVMEDYNQKKKKKYVQSSL